MVQHRDAGRSVVPGILLEYLLARGVVNDCDFGMSGVLGSKQVGAGSRGFCDRDLRAGGQKRVGERPVTRADLEDVAVALPRNGGPDQGGQTLLHHEPQPGVGEVGRPLAVVVTLTVRRVLGRAHRHVVSLSGTGGVSGRQEDALEAVDTPVQRELRLGKAAGRGPQARRRGARR